MKDRRGLNIDRMALLDEVVDIAVSSFDIADETYVQVICQITNNPDEE